MKRPKLPRPTRTARGIGYCEHRNKAQYLTEDDALKAMVFIWSRDPSIGMYDLHVYNDCPCCKYWHVGHKDDRFDSNP